MNTSSSLIASTPLGQVAYRLEGGSGPLLAGLHGSPGSAEQILMVMDKMGLDSSLCRRLAIDRAGYKDTPLKNCRKMSEQADLFAALLDELHIEALDVLVAFSGGGIMALEFAVRHPRRVKKLLLLSAVTGAHSPYHRTWFNRIIFTAPVMNFLVTISYLFPQIAVKHMIAFMSTFSSRTVKQEFRKVNACSSDRDFILNLLRLNSPFGRLCTGWKNDTHEFHQANINDYAELDLPVLLLHGRYDSDVDFSYSEDLYKSLDCASLIEVKDGYHLLMVGERFRDVQERIFEFCGIR
ncbi:MAG: alpha/beta hydrolase [Victivallales bacterium]|nr:alpha/beta hydrolase [Victivallales bacterium]